MAGRIIFFRIVFLVEQRGGRIGRIENMDAVFVRSLDNGVWTNPHDQKTCFSPIFPRQLNPGHGVDRILGFFEHRRDIQYRGGRKRDPVTFPCLPDKDIPRKRDASLNETSGDFALTTFRSS